MQIIIKAIAMVTKYITTDGQLMVTQLCGIRLTALTEPYKVIMISPY